MDVFGLIGFMFGMFALVSASAAHRKLARLESELKARGVIGEQKEA